MMRLFRVGLFTGVPIGVMLACVAPILAFDKPVKMEQLPTAVRETVERETKNATLRGLSKETENGKTTYEAETTLGGKSRDILIDSTGAVVEIEEQVDFDSLAPEVKAQIQNHADKVIKVEAVTKGGQMVYYEATIQKNGRKSEIQVGTDGKLIPKGKH